MSTRTTIKINNEETNQTKWYKVTHDSYPYSDGNSQMIHQYQNFVRDYIQYGSEELYTNQMNVEIKDESNLKSYLGMNSYLVEINLNKQNPNFRIFGGNHRYSDGKGGYSDDWISSDYCHSIIKKYREDDSITQEERNLLIDDLLYHPSDYYHTKKMNEEWLIETHTYDTQKSEWVYERDIEKLLKWETDNQIHVGHCTSLIDGYVRNEEGYLVKEELETIKD